jgi:hypothetical protein
MRHIAGVLAGAALAALVGLSIASSPVPPRPELPPGLSRYGFFGLDDGTWLGKAERFDAVVDPHGTLTVANGSRKVTLTSDRPAEVRGGPNGTVERRSSGVVETLRATRDGLEQSWTFDAWPLGMPLAVRLKVDGAEAPVSDAQGLTFASALGAFHYGNGMWVDAKGARTNIPVRFDRGAIVLEVPSDVIARTAWPATLDPTLSMESPANATPAVEAAPGFRSTVAMTFQTGSTQMLVVWTDSRRDFIGGNNGVPNLFGIACDYGAGCLTPEYVPIAVGVEPRQEPAVTFANGQYFVTWTQGDQPNRRIRGAFVPVMNITRPLQEIGVDQAAPNEAFASSVAFGAGVLMVGYEHSPTVGIDFVLIDATTLARAGPFPLTTAQYESQLSLGWTTTRFFAAWAECISGSVTASVRTATAFLDGGVTPAGGSLFVTGTNTGTGWEPVTAWNGSNGILAWEEERASTRHDIFIARVNTSGASLDGTGYRITDAGDNAAPRAVQTSTGTTQLVAYVNTLNGLFPNPAYRRCTFNSTGSNCNNTAISVTSPNTLYGYDIGGTGIIAVAQDGIITVDNATPLDKAEAAQERPEIAYLGAGSLTVWEQSKAGAYDIWGRLEDGGAIPISVNAANVEKTPAVAASDAGYLVVWTDNRNGNFDIYGARVSPAGQLLDSSGFAINTEAQNVNTPPRVTFVGGHFLVVWGNQKPFSGQNPNGTAFELARVNTNGTLIDPVGAGVFFPDGGPRGIPGGMSLASAGNISAYAQSVFPGAVTLSTINGATVTTVPGIPNGYSPALASDGTNFWLFEAAGSPPAMTVTAEVLGPSGNVVAFPFPVGRAIGVTPLPINHLSAGRLGSFMVVAWDTAPDAGWREVEVAALYPDGGTAARFTTAGIDESLWPALGSSDSFTNTLAYVKEDDWNPVGGDPRVYVRTLVVGDNGAPCVRASDCATGFCTEGVCCDQACNGGICQTCLAVGAKPAGTCGFQPATLQCRAPVDVCDAPELCTGAAATCPADSRVDAGVVCRAAAEGCDLSEVCDGTATACPPDLIADGGVVCQSTALPCALPGVCNGTSKVCPPMPGVRDAGEICRPIAGDCDVPEVCDGINNTCPTDGFKVTTISCRAPAGPCDIEEFCLGNAPNCPADQLYLQTHVCLPRDMTMGCDVDDFCSGNDAGCPSMVADTSTICRPHANSCDLDDKCDGVHTLCPGDDKVGNGEPCTGSAGVCLDGVCVYDAGFGPAKEGSPYGFGCGCGTGGGPGVLVLLAAWLARRRRRAGWLVLAAVVASGAALAAPKQPRIVFQGVRAGSGVSAETAGTVADYVQSELSQLGAYEVIGQNELVAMLGVERQKALLGCGEEGACLTELGGALDAERMIVGDLSRVDDLAILNLSLVDMKASKAIARVGRKVALSGSKLGPLFDEVRPMLYEMLNKDPTNAAHPLKQERSFGGFVIGVLGDTDVLGPRIAPGLTAELSGRWIGGALTVLPKASFGARLEARFYPLVLGIVRPYVAAGITAFTTELGIRGAAGASFRIFAGLQAFFDVGYERFVVQFAPNTQTFNRDSVVIGVGLGWQV